MAERKRFLINTTYFFVIGLITFLTVKFLLGYLLPFVLAFLLAAVLQPICDKVSKKLKVKRFFVSFVCVLALYLLLGLLLFGLIFFLIKFAESFYSDIPIIISEFMDSLEELYNSIKNEISKISEITIEIESSLKSLLSENAGVKFSSFVGKFVKRTPSFLLSFIIMFIATFYFANDYKKLVHFANEILPEKAFVNIARIKNIFFHNVVKISFAYLILGLITFAELVIFFFIFNIKRALILAFLISVIDLLPVLGAGIVLIPWCIIAFITGKATLGIKLLFIYAVLTVVRNFTEPKILSKQTGVGPLLTLISIFLGLKTMGALGAIVLPILVTVLFEFYRGE